jgi:Flp pilus assembly protein TadD
MPPEESTKLPSGMQEAQKAAQIDSTLSDAHIALGMSSAALFEWSAAEREFKLAIASNSNDATAHYFYAQLCLMPLKRFDEALKEFQFALQLDPLSPIINTNYGVAMEVAGRFDAAREQLRKTLELDPNFRVALGRSSELEAYLGNYELARQLIIRHDPKAATLDFGSGKDGYYRARLRLEEEGHLFQHPVFLAMLGEKDETFRQLDLSFAIDPQDLIFWIRRPEYNSLHSDPRFAELLKRMNLPE